MQPKVTVRDLGGKQLLGTARHHAVVTDRTRDEGGSDTGCTSGELLLLAIASCSAGSLRAFFEQRGAPCGNLKVDVYFEPAAVPDRRDRIVIAPRLDERARGLDTAAIRSAVMSGGVVSRMNLGSDVEVRIAA